MNNQDEVRDEFYRDCGQFCNDAFDQVADWWLSKFDTLLAKKREEAKNLKEKDEWKEGEGGSLNSYEFNRGVDAVIKILS